MMQNRKRRVGLMGGTFDPIHIGHLMLAECAYEQFQLDSVLFLPSGNPPHKCDRPDGASDEQRLEMVCLAIKGNPHFGLEPEEMQHAGLTYTNETLVRLNRLHPDMEFYFIIGADSLMAFDTWKNPEIICQNCVLTVAVRDHLDHGIIRQQMEHLKEKYGAVIHLLKTPEIEVSSSTLRLWCRRNRSIRYYVTDNVFEYIEKNQIYKEKKSVREHSNEHIQSPENAEKTEKIH